MPARIYRSRRSRSRFCLDASMGAIESLERRILLANFAGTSAADTISISSSGGIVYVNINGVQQQSSDPYVNVYAQGGNDTVFIRQITKTSTYKPYIDVDLGDGNDFVGTDSSSLDASDDGVVFIQAGTGNDALDVDASSSSRITTFDFNVDANDNYLAAGPAHDGGFFYYDSTLENFTLDCGQQNDTVTLAYKPNTTHLAVNGEGGNDEFLVGTENSFVGNVNCFSNIANGLSAGTVTLSGGVGNDIAEYDDRNGGIEPGGYIIGSSDINVGSNGVHYVTLESQSLKPREGTVVNVNATNPFTSTILNATSCTINLNSISSPATVNGSNCTVNVGNGNLDNIAAPVTLNMSPTVFTDLLNINDQNSIANNTYIFYSGSFIGHNSADPINFTGLDQVVLNAGSGNDEIAPNATSSGESITANGNGGNDLLELSSGDVADSLLGPVSFDGGTGSDTFFIANAFVASSGVLTAKHYIEAGVTHTYSNCELVHLVGGVSNSTNLEIDSLTIPASIRGGSAPDHFQIGAGNLPAIVAPITLDGQSGNDALLVDDHLAPVANGYTINSDQISDSNEVFSIANIESETLQGSDHDDSFDIRSSVPDLNILGGAGNDLIFSEGGSANIDTGSETPNSAGDGVVVNFGGSGSSMRLLKTDRIGEMDIYNGGKFEIPSGVILDVGSLSVFNGSILDMGGAMIERNASASLDQYATRIRAGYAAGNWNGTSTGAPVINSSLANSTSISDSVGYALAANLLNISGTQTGSWEGQTINPSDVLVKYTYAGDANLDGKINIDDYGRIDSNVGRSGTVFGWYNGDFNYDAKINIDDYGIIDANIGAQGPPIEQTGIDNLPASE